METNGRATIREVYEIANRIEDKLDQLGERVTSVEGRQNAHEDLAGHPKVMETLAGLSRRIYVAVGAAGAVGVAVAVASTVKS